MHCSLTLNFIRENWCSATASMDRRSFCREILPDSYDAALCQGQGGHFLDSESNASLMEQTLMGLMRGNRKSLKNLTFASVAFTKDFQQKLAHNSPIRYRNPGREPETTVENMLGKLRRLIRRFCAPMDRNHMLFTHMDLTALGEGPEGPEYERLRLALEVLLDRETEATLTYALFLMIVTAILQSRLGTLQHLYSPEAVQRVLADDREAPAMEVDNRTHAPFTDPNYMHTYHIYYYHDSRGENLYRGRLTMGISNNRPSASMVLTAQTVSPVAGELDITRVFTGVPMLARREQMVYIPMTDEKDAFVYLTFPYEHYNFTPMYFRSGILIRISSHARAPVAQRVVIVARELGVEEMPYIWGLLKTGGKQMMLTEPQYRIFREKFRDYPWMPDFEAHYAPQFEAHKKTVYCFNEEELLAWSIGDLSHRDRIRILLALRSVDNPGNTMQDKFLESVSPNRTHSIMK